MVKGSAFNRAYGRANEENGLRLKTLYPGGKVEKRPFNIAQEGRGVGYGKRDGWGRELKDEETLMAETSRWREKKIGASGETNKNDNGCKKRQKERGTSE